MDRIKILSAGSRLSTTGTRRRDSILEEARIVPPYSANNIDEANMSFLNVFSHCGIFLRAILTPGILVSRQCLSIISARLFRLRIDLSFALTLCELPIGHCQSKVPLRVTSATLPSLLAKAHP